jgi:uncharacterized protein
MKFVWDELKRQRNIETHGLDFIDVRERFEFSSALIEQTYPSADGRTRFKAIGSIDDDLYVVVFSLLGTEAVSIISFRPASRKERSQYV